jgi:RES domain-containing protein
VPGRRRSYAGRRAASGAKPLAGASAGGTCCKWRAPASVGDSWVRSRSPLALVVPSVVLQAEDNVLVNPAHLQIDRVGVFPPEPVAFDRRLLP